jgi:TPR repeat protein
MSWARYYGDRKDALKWFTKAAEQGDERAKKALEELKSK